ncbi:ImmA/IrrE family metallo-endopeptidase [Aliihoeflea sp. PC F10.4]
MNEVDAKPLRESNKITQMLDLVYGTNRFERGPVPVEHIALTYSRDISPDGPIHDVQDIDIPGCMGALVFSESRPRQWSIVCHRGQSVGRRAFTIAHEFGHFILHRALIDESDEYEDGIYCSEDSVLRRAGSGIEKEADIFAANLLMPLNDFRKQIPAKMKANFDMLGAVADRYGVSLTAAILRWLEYTETRAMMVVSNEGFAHWARPSEAALKSGLYIKTKDVMYELPHRAAAVRKDYTDETKQGFAQSAGVWFKEPVIEMCMRSDRYDQEITLLHFEDLGPRWQGEEAEDDAYDRFVTGGRV